MPRKARPQNVSFCRLALSTICCLVIFPALVPSTLLISCNCSSLRNCPLLRQSALTICTRASLSPRNFFDVCLIWSAKTFLVETDPNSVHRRLNSNGSFKPLRCVNRIDGFEKNPDRSGG